jgi:ribose-phosphate pyrophosphokinase
MKNVRIHALTNTNQIIEIDNNVYPDNVPIVQHPKYYVMGQARPFEGSLKSILVRPLTMTDLLAALFFVDAFKWRGYDLPTLVLPSVPGARQDRLNNTGDFLFTAKSVANMINERQFRKVIVLDPHSEVIAGLINNCEVVHSDIAFHLSGYFYQPKYCAVVSPDAGAEKRAGMFAKAMKVPLIHAWKSRDVKDGKITGFGHEPFAPTDKVLIVDDICDGGGTFLGLGDKLAESNINADLFVTHGIFSQGTKALTKRFENVYTTDSIVNRPEDIPGVKVIEICEQLMKGNY